MHTLSSRPAVLCFYFTMMVDWLSSNTKVSVQFSYRIYVSRSLVIKIMTAAWTHSSYAESF